jgi:hypothetical protein
MLRFPGPEPVQEMLAHLPGGLQGIAYGSQPVFQRSPDFLRKIIQVGFHRFRIQGRGLPGQLIQVRDKGVYGVDREVRVAGAGAASPSEPSACPASPAASAGPAASPCSGSSITSSGICLLPAGLLFMANSKSSCGQGNHIYEKRPFEGLKCL